MRTLHQLQEDLSPQIGHPGGPCQTIRRIEAARLPAPQKQKYIDTIEDGDDLSNTDASKVYKPLTEPLPAGLVYKEFQLSAHAQYRMDLRGIAVPQLRAALTAFIKHVLDMKSQRHPTYERWISQETSRSRDTIVWTDARLGLTIVLAPTLLTKSLTVVTTYWQNVADEPPPGDDGCALWTPEYDRPAPRPVEESRKSISRRSPSGNRANMNENQQFPDGKVISHIKSMTLPGRLPIWIFGLAALWDKKLKMGWEGFALKGHPHPRDSGVLIPPLDLLYGHGLDPSVGDDWAGVFREADYVLKYADNQHTWHFLQTPVAVRQKIRIWNMVEPRVKKLIADWEQNTPEGRKDAAALAFAKAHYDATHPPQKAAAMAMKLIVSGQKALELLTAAWRNAAPEEYEETEKEWNKKIGEIGDRKVSFTHYSRD